MKKIISILCLLVLLFGNLTQCFANNNYTEEELGNIMLNFFNAEVEKNNTTTDIQESNTYKPSEIKEEGEDEIEYVGGDEHIVWNKTKGIITVYTGDLRFGITLEDKNLGAENIGNTGNYYKWGNNSSINTENYKNIQSIKEANAWGGGDDLDTSNSSIFRGYDLENHKVTNSISRQGPCNEGFHVPSAGEISELVKLYYNLKGMSNSINDRQGGSQIYDSNLNFINDLKIPRAGVIGNGTYFNEGDSFFQSSTKKGEYYGYHFYQTSTNIMSNGSSRDIDYGIPVRCFKNEYVRHPKTVTFYANGGTFSGGTTREQYTYNYSGSEIIPIYNIQIPDRISDNMSQQSGWMFAGWYTKDGSNGNWGEEFDSYLQNASIVYAKWLPFNDLDLGVIGLPGIKIMDRNMGAETISQGIYKDDNLGKLESQDTWGLFYQRGNNYGFKYGANNKITNIENDTNKYISGINYGPNNYYYNSEFKIPDTYIAENGKNMWGGENIMNDDSNRKGPCPKGYHIPTTYEFNTIFKIFKNNAPELCSTIGIYKCFNKIFKIPYTNQLSYNSGIPNAGDGFNVGPNHEGGTQSYFRTSQASDNRNGKGIYITLNNFSESTYFISAGETVRCFKDYEKKNKLIINTDNGLNNVEYNLKRWETLNNYEQNIPTKKGYTFSGWIDNENNSVSFGRENYLTQDTIIKAIWKKNPRYVYNANNGLFNNGESIKNRLFNYKIINTKYSHTDNVNDEGIDFGYYNNTAYNRTGIITITGATWIDLTIKYFGNKSSNGDDYLLVFSGIQSNITDPNNNSLLFNLSGRDNAQFKKYRINGDSISYFFKSFENSYGPGYGYYIKVEGLKLESDDKIGTPGKTGYSFSGWYETGAIEEFDFNSIPVTKDRTFYAKWDPNHYTIKFDTGDIEDMNATYGEEIILPLITKEGYTFKGWQAEDGTIYKNSIPGGTGATAEDGATVTLTAQREKIQEPQKQVQTSSAGGGSTITSNNKDIKKTEQEHKSADTVKKTETTTQESTPNETTNQSVEEKIQTISPKSLTRGELAVFSDILLDIFPKLTEGKKNVNEVCTEYTDYQEFSSKEQKAVSKLCRLAIMGIHEDDKTPIETFGVHDLSTNEEFIKVVNRMTDKYSEEELKDLKSALSSLEENKEENLSFGTVVNIFKKVKNLFE